MCHGQKKVSSSSKNGVRNSGQSPWLTRRRVSQRTQWAIIYSDVSLPEGKQPMWRFPKVGQPLNHPNSNGFFHYKPTILGYGNPHVVTTPQRRSFFCEGDRILGETLDWDDV